MIDFSLPTLVDFVYVTLGSLSVRNTAELIRHFNSVAAVLKEGGLYFLEWCIQFTLPGCEEVWEIKRAGIRVKAKVSSKGINPVKQTFVENIILEVDDHGKHLTLVEKNIKRAIYPQEFLCFISNHQNFEFVGWWNNWDFNQPLEKATDINRPIVLVQRI